jgi:hypothetical protein
MTWDRRLYFPSEGRRAEDFFALKNPMASAGFEPANLGTKGQHATPRPLKPLKGFLSFAFKSSILKKENLVGFCRIRWGQKHNWHLQDTVVYSYVKYCQIQASRFVSTWLQFYFSILALHALWNGKLGNHNKPVSLRGGWSVAQPKIDTALNAEGRGKQEIWRECNGNNATININI